VLVTKKYFGIDANIFDNPVKYVKIRLEIVPQPLPPDPRLE
jgi:hypothetical protein